MTSPWTAKKGKCSSLKINVCLVRVFCRICCTLTPKTTYIRIPVLACTWCQTNTRVHRRYSTAVLLGATECEQGPSCCAYGAGYFEILYVDPPCCVRCCFGRPPSIELLGTTRRALCCSGNTALAHGAQFDLLHKQYVCTAPRATLGAQHTQQHRSSTTKTNNIFWYIIHMYVYTRSSCSRPFPLPPFSSSPLMSSLLSLLLPASSVAGLCATKYQ